MARPSPSLNELRLAWERHLLAKVQMVELQAWGESTLGLVRNTVTEYSELEAAYVSAMVERRKAHAETKKVGR